MTKQQENRAFVKMLKEFPKAFGRVSFRERLMLRTAFSYVVEEVIADIKANCDLAIEGRDIKIKELEKENKRLKGDLELYESGGCRATNLFECGVVKELKEQLTKATELLRKLVLEVTGYEEIYGYDTCEPVQEAEQFLRETDIDNAIQKANEGLDLDKIAEEVEQDIKEQKVK